MPLPKEMKRNGRTAEQDFDTHEKLWRRFRPEHLLPDGRLDLASVELPDMSTNREKFGGRPEFVLYPYYLMDGVGEFSVEDIPTPRFKAGSQFTFLPWHVPEEDNYQHTEVQCRDREGRHVDPRQHFDRAELLRWRTILRNKLKVVIQADPLRTDI